MPSASQLHQQLESLDGKGYGAYKSLKGQYQFPDFTLHIDTVQGDPFAAPSRVRVALPQTVAQFPEALYTTPSRATALADLLTRQFYQAAPSFLVQQGSGKSGLIEIARPSQVVLNRTAVQVSATGVDVRFTLGLPAFGRRIAGRQAVTLLCDRLPQLIHQTLLYENLDAGALQHHGDVVESADWLRSQLPAHDLVAFVADGAILPRRSGVDDRPLAQALPFQSPASLRVQFELPNGITVTGMGIPPGITLIVGGGYHGKSTLLRAIAAGIYSHIPGDGREFVVTHPSAVKIRAEEGRSVTGVDISPFINHLPQGISTQHFSTPNASGSTSQAANLIEAVGAGAQVLLIDEDTSATNFMIRDRRMQALIAKAHEPITPFVDKVRQLYVDHGVSTILVMGGSGNYFDVADTVIALETYHPQNVTAQARAIAAQYPTTRIAEGGDHFGAIPPRVILPDGIDPSQGRRDIKIKGRGTDEIRLGQAVIDLTAVEALMEPAQLRAIALAMVYAQRHYLDGDRSLKTVLSAIMADLGHNNLDRLTDYPRGDLASFRALDLAAALNRLRSLQVQSPVPASSLSTKLC
jgi:predicted ABC-class ATPase